MPVHILVECPDLIASVQVGVLQCLKPLQAEGKCVLCFKKTHMIKSGDIRWCDVLITVRGAESATLRLVRAAKRHSRFIIYYLDDDLLHVPTGDSCPEWCLNQVVRRNLPAVLSYADVLWGVNDKIREKYLQFCGGGKWISNKVPVDLTEHTLKKKNGGECIKFLYAGSTSHQEMVRELLCSAVRAIAQKYQERVDFTFIGANSGIEDCTNVHNYEIMKDYQEYRTFVENGNFDIGLAVVKTEEFYQCKYYNKYLEYTSIGCAGIYTDSKPYTYVIEDKKNGLLCDNSMEGWYQAMELLIEDFEKRYVYYQNALQQIRTEHDYKLVVEKLAADIPQLIEYKAEKISRWKIVLLPFSKSLYYGMERCRQILREYPGLKGGGLILSKGFHFFKMRIGKGKNV